MDTAAIVMADGSVWRVPMGCAEQYQREVDVVTEHEIQSHVIRWAREMAQLYPELALLHAIPNQRKNTAAGRIYMWREGLESGVPDLDLPVARNGWHGLRIEMKTEKGKVTDNQRWWLDELGKQGYLAVVCRSIYEAQNTILDYLNIRGNCRAA
jgi:hypothetical protein